MIKRKGGRWLDEDSFGVDYSHTDAAAAVDVFLSYCEQCEQATEEYDVQPLCAIKRPAVGCWHLGSGGTKTTIYSILDYFHRRIWLMNPSSWRKLGPLLSRFSPKSGLGRTVAR